MAEGRMQCLTHHSEEVVWQTRWLDHANGAEALLDVVIAVEDVAEAAERFSRFLDRDFVSETMGKLFPLERGGVLLMERVGVRRKIRSCSAASLQRPLWP